MSHMKPVALLQLKLQLLGALLQLNYTLMASSSSRILRNDGHSGSFGEAFGSFNTRILCECQLNSRYRISHSWKNPNRPFLRCPNIKGVQCSFFKWVDELDAGEIRKLLEVDFGEERQDMWIEDRSVLRIKLEEFQAKVKDLKNTKKKMKKELLCSRIVIFILLVFILIPKLG